MKAVLISTQSKWVEKIANRKKTIEVRKTAPKQVPFKCYIYCTSAKPYLYKEANPPFELFLDSELYKGKGYDDRLFSSKIIGEFVCDRIDEIYQCNSGWVKENACISKDEFFDYLGIPRGTHFGYDKKAYAWHISDLKIYDKPKVLAEFERPCTYKGICYSCERFRPNGIPLPAPYGFCETKITHVPSNWCYVEEL